MLKKVILAILLVVPSIVFAYEPPLPYLYTTKLGGMPLPKPDSRGYIKYPEKICEISAIQTRETDRQKTIDRIKEIWDKYAPKFKYKNWQYVAPDAVSYNIEIYYGGNKIYLVVNDDFQNGKQIARVGEKQEDLDSKLATVSEIIAECKDWNKK